jgi:IS30 family transposase
MSKVKGSIALTTTELGKVKVLAGLGYSYRRIAKEIGKSDHTVKRALKSPEMRAQVETIKKDLGDIFKDLAHRMVESITDADITKLNAYQRTVSAAIATDKSQLLSGQPTMNVALLMEVVELLREKQDQADEAYMRKLREQHALPAPPADLQ